MARVERGNVVLTIPDSDIKRYMDMGYNVIDEKGKVIQACVPTDLGTLRQAFVNQTEKIKQYEEKIRQLERKIESLQTPEGAETKDSGSDGNESDTDQPEKKARVRKSKE